MIVIEYMVYMIYDVTIFHGDSMEISWVIERIAHDPISRFWIHWVSSP